jgi:glutathione S-transferase
MITVHHLNNSRSQRILWLLEELKVPYKIKRYERDSKTFLAPKELKDVHPLGKSPVITDGESTIAESGAIVEYLINNYGKDKISHPKEGKDYEQLIYWMHFAEGSMMPPLVMKLIFNRIKLSPMPFFIKPIAKKIANTVIKSYIDPNIKDNLNFIEAHLNKNEWFSGAQFTGADILMIFPLEAGIERIKDNSVYPMILNFIRKVQSKETYQKALTKGGKYDFAH